MIMRENNVANDTLDELTQETGSEKTWMWQNLCSPPVSFPHYPSVYLRPVFLSVTVVSYLHYTEWFSL